MADLEVGKLYVQFNLGEDRAGHTLKQWAHSRLSSGENTRRISQYNWAKGDDAENGNLG